MKTRTAALIAVWGISLGFGLGATIHPNLMFLAFIGMLVFAHTVIVNYKD